MITFEYIDETQAGLKKGSVQAFLKELKHNKVNLHSVILMHRGRVFCEKYARGFDENFRHRLYSVSKTFVSTAVGIAIGEGLISYDTKIADYFPDKCPGGSTENLHPYLKNLTVRNCLNMATPFDVNAYTHDHDDWVQDFFNNECTHRGGSLFRYDTGATLILCALIKRVTGKHFNEYLYEKCLKYIGYEAVPPCVESPEGNKWGGSGMLCTTREFAAFARLWNNDGKTDGECQIIPYDFVTEAKRKTIGNQEDNVHNNLRGQGYGFQTWMLKSGWAMFGMGNQLALSFPEQELIFVCTGDDQGNVFARNYILDLIEKHFLIPMGAKQDEEEDDELCMPLPMGELKSEKAKDFSGVEYITEKGRTGIERAVFTFDEENNCGEMKFSARGEEKVIKFGFGKFVEFEFPEKGYSGDRINTPIERGYRSYGAAAWDLDDLLVIRVYAADMYFGVMTVNVRFCEEGVDMRFTKTAEWFFDEYNGYVTGNKA